MLYSTRFVVVSLHRERLAAARLAVRKDGRIVALQHRLHHFRHASAGEDLRGWAME